MQRAGQHDQCIRLPGRLLGLGEPIAVALAVAELQRILRGNAGADLLDRARIEEALEPLARAHAHVVAALGAHVQIAFQLGAVEHRIAGRDT